MSRKYLLFVLLFGGLILFVLIYLSSNFFQNSLSLQKITSQLSGEDTPILVINDHPSLVLKLNNEKALREILEKRFITKSGIALKNETEEVSVIEIIFDDIDHKKLSIWSDLSVKPSVQVSSGSYTIENEALRIYLQLSQKSIDTGMISEQSLVSYLNKQLIDVLVLMSQSRNFAPTHAPSESSFPSASDVNADSLFAEYFQGPETAILSIND